MGQQLAATGQLTTLAALAQSDGSSPERTRLRRAALDAGRATRAAQRNRVLAGRLRDLGFDDLAGYSRHARSTGLSLRGIAKATGLGWARLRREMGTAGLAVGQPTLRGRRMTTGKIPIQVVPVSAVRHAGSTLGPPRQPPSAGPPAPR